MIPCTWAFGGTRGVLVFTVRITDAPSVDRVFGTP
jgi:hypothetical protein